VFAGLLMAGALAAQVAGPANAGYQTEQQRKAWLAVSATRRATNGRSPAN